MLLAWSLLSVCLCCDTILGMRTGLINNGNYCFVNAAMQTLHKTPFFVRELYAAAAEPDANHIMVALAQVFGRLTEFSSPVDVNWDFYPVYRRLGQIDPVNVPIPPSQDDSSMFIDYLIRHVLPPRFYTMFMIKSTTWMELDGQRVREPRSEAYSLAKIASNAVCGAPMPDVAEFKKIPPELFYDPQNPLNRATVRLAHGMRINETDAENSPVDQVTLNTSNGPIIQLVAEPAWEGPPRTVYLRRSVIAEDDTGAKHTYDLYSIICFAGRVKGGGGHYWAVTQVNPERDEWYVFNDRLVSPIDFDKIQGRYGQEARMLFYVRRSVQEQYQHDRQWRIPVPQAIHDENLRLAGIEAYKRQVEAAKNLSEAIKFTGYVLLGSGSIILLATAIIVHLPYKRRSASLRY